MKSTAPPAKCRVKDRGLQDNAEVLNRYSCVREEISMFVCRILWPISLQRDETRKIEDGTGWTARLEVKIWMTSSIGSDSMSQVR